MTIVESALLLNASDRCVMKRIHMSVQTALLMMDVLLLLLLGLVTLCAQIAVIPQRVLTKNPLEMTILLNCATHALQTNVIFYRRDVTMPILTSAWREVGGMGALTTSTTGPLLSMESALNVVTWKHVTRNNVVGEANLCISTSLRYCSPVSALHSFFSVLFLVITNCCSRSEDVALSIIYVVSCREVQHRCWLLNDATCQSEGAMRTMFESGTY
jgi:hypothetical protein